MPRPWRVVIAWMLVLGVASILGRQFHRSIGADDLSVRGSEAARGQARLLASGLMVAAETDAAVFTSTTRSVGDADFRRVVETALRRARRKPHVAFVLSPYDQASQVS